MICVEYKKIPFQIATKKELNHYKNQLKKVRRKRFPFESDLQFSPRKLAIAGKMKLSSDSNLRFKKLRHSFLKNNFIWWFVISK